MKLICIGDSLVYGYGVRVSQRWTGLLSSADWEVENLGVNGDTTGGILPRLCSRLEKLSPADPAVLFVLGGCNDIFYSGTDTAARANMGAMLQQILSKGQIPVLGIPMPIGDDSFPEAWARVVDFKAASAQIVSYREWLKSFCGAFGVNYIDFGEVIDKSLLIDGLHPSPEGHKKIAGLVENSLRSIR